MFGVMQPRHLSKIRAMSFPLTKNQRLQRPSMGCCGGRDGSVMMDSKDPSAMWKSRNAGRCIPNIALPFNFRVSMANLQDSF